MTPGWLRDAGREEGIKADREGELGEGGAEAGRGQGGRSRQEKLANGRIGTGREGRHETDKKTGTQAGGQKVREKRSLRSKRFTASGREKKKHRSIAIVNEDIRH